MGIGSPAVAAATAVARPAGRGANSNTAFSWYAACWLERVNGKNRLLISDCSFHDSWSGTGRRFSTRVERFFSRQAAHGYCEFEQEVVRPKFSVGINPSSGS